MPQVDLKGKTVMISTRDSFYAQHNKEKMEGLGATVVFSHDSPDHPGNIPSISDEVEKHNPKIDALIIFNSNIELLEPQTVALEMKNRFKKSCPVIVCDDCNRVADIQPLQDAGAKYLNWSRMNPDKIAVAVADAVAQHGKPGRPVGV
jgi:hypothetical protein